MPDEKDKIRHPDAFILDIGDAVAAYEKQVKPIGDTVQTDVSKVVNYITDQISSRDYDETELYDGVSEIEYQMQDAGVRSNVINCFTDAAMKLGTTIVKQLNNFGLYDPNDGRFDFYFAGWATEKSAVFRRREEPEGMMMWMYRDGPPPQQGQPTDEEEDSDEEDDESEKN
jgi:hypothetical protein